MTRRASTTILLITRQTLARADLTAGPKPRLLDVWVQPRPDLPDLGMLTEAALALGPRPGRSVWVLSSDLWTQTLTLPAVRAIGLTRADLASALNFEAESLSGIAAIEADVGFAALPSAPGESTFWIVQARTMERDQVEEVIRKAGGQLAGLCHPAGLPRSLSQEAAAEKPWQRVELWPDAVVCLHGEPGGKMRVQVLNSSPQLGRWKADWESWRRGFERPEHSEMLIDAGLASPPDHGAAQVLRLDSDSVLSAWLTACAARLGSGAVDVPSLKRPRRPLSNGRRKVIAAALALVVAAGCFAHQRWLDQSAQAAKAETQAALEPGKKLADLQKRRKDLEPKRVELQVQAKQLEDSTELLRVQRKRLAQMLTSLSVHKAEDLLVQKIDTDSGEPCIRGVCLHPELADHFASKLAAALFELGWEVQSPRKQAQNRVPGGGPWSFDIPFRRLVVAAPVETPSPGKKGGRR